MRRLLIALGILLLVPTSAFAGTKQVLVHKTSYYLCYSASDCRFEWADEQYEDVDSAARLVATDQQVRSCTTYPCYKEIETTYYWAICSTGGCPLPFTKEVEE